MKKSSIVSVIVVFCMLFAVVFSTVSFAAPAYSLGDVDMDGSVTMSDARIVLRHALSIEIFSMEEEYILADADGSYDVTMSDARLILRYSLNLDSALDGQDTYEELYVNYSLLMEDSSLEDSSEDTSDSESTDEIPEAISAFVNLRYTMTAELVSDSISLEMIYTVGNGNCSIFFEEDGFNIGILQIVSGSKAGYYIINPDNNCYMSFDKLLYSMRALGGDELADEFEEIYEIIDLLSSLFEADIDLETDFQYSMEAYGGTTAYCYTSDTMSVVFYLNDDGSLARVEYFMSDEYSPYMALYIDEFSSDVPASSWSLSNYTEANNITVLFGFSL